MVIISPPKFQFLSLSRFDQVLQLCDNIITKKGKDPIIVFWRAFALGMNGNISDAIRTLEGLTSRKDFHLPTTIALIYFHQKASVIDAEAVDTLNSELKVVGSEVTKEAGKILAARFSLFTGDTTTASRIARELITLEERGNGGRGGGNPTSVFEMEAMAVENWALLQELEASKRALSSSDSRVGRLQSFDSTMRSRQDQLQYDPDLMLLWAKVRSLLGFSQEALHTLNQCVAANSWFSGSLCEKALLLAGAGEWDQALDAAQRILDTEQYNLDALKVLAVHAFTQEAHTHDAVQKFEELEEALNSREPSSTSLQVEVADLMQRVCCRQPRALVICRRIIERAQRRFLSSSSSQISSNTVNLGQEEEVSRLWCVLGHICLKQGYAHSEAALKYFSEASKLDPSNLAPMEGMILTYLLTGQLEDAEGQIELMLVMHNEEDLSFLAFYLRALLAKGNRDNKSYLSYLETCREKFMNEIREGLDKPPHFPFKEFFLSDPDFQMILGAEFISQVESSLSSSVYSLSKRGGGIGGSSTDGGTGDSGSSMNTAATGTTTYQANAGGVRFGGSSLDTFSSSASTMMFGSGTGMTVSGMSSGMGSRDSASMAMGGMGMGTDIMSDTSLPAQTGMAFMSRVIQLCPAFICAYIESARCQAALGSFDEAVRTLTLCLHLQPQCVGALVSLAKVELCRKNIGAANRALEQALSSDFSIRSSPLFRLVQVMVRAHQGKTEEMIAEIENILALPELKSFGSGPPSSHDSEYMDEFTGVSSKAAAQTAPSSSTSNHALHDLHTHTDPLRLTDEDRVGAYIAYSSLLSRGKRLKEAKKVLGEAKIAFAGTNLEVQVLVAASELAVERNDFDSAVRMLNKVSEDSPTFSRAQIIKAEILLNNHRDKEGFTQCYRLLVEREKSSKNYSQLAEAYLRILNPEAAVEALEEAYRLDKNNSRLRARIGRALVATHEYHRAIEFYSSAIRELTSGDSTASSRSSTEIVSLSHDLAKLYLKLGRLEPAVRVLTQALTRAPRGGRERFGERDNRDTRDTIDLRQDVITLLLLSDVQSQSSPETVLGSLERALESQRDLLGLIRSEVVGKVTSSETFEREKASLSNILVKIAKLHFDREKTEKPVSREGGGAKLKEFRFTEQHLQEALRHNPQNTKAMLLQATVHRLRNDQEACMQECRKILHSDPSDESAAILLSDVIMMGSEPESPKEESKGDGDGKEDEIVKVNSSNLGNPELALEPLQSLLKTNPSNYRSLKKFISIARRAGALEQVPLYLAAAEKADRRCISHAGYHFCLGLYARYTNDIGRAIVEFNLARRDDTWGHDALVHMIELYLNPDQESAWEEREEGSEGEQGPLSETSAAYLSAAESLLKELEPRARDRMRFTVLQNYYLLATRSKANISKAMASFISMLEETKDQDYLPAILGMATGFMVERNQHKARNLLKRVARLPLSLAAGAGAGLGLDGEGEWEGEDFEKANLLLARFYVDKSKFDLSQELCQRALTLNRSSGPAWEVLGLIKEKGGEYDQAAECYKKAWKLDFEASAPVGFKLAFCLMKSSRHVEAVDVCESVLNQYPDYPRIKEEILKKSLQAVRTKE